MLEKVRNEQPVIARKTVNSGLTSLDVTDFAGKEGPVSSKVWSSAGLLSVEKIEVMLFRKLITIAFKCLC
jgi:hypothetical protein